MADNLTDGRDHFIVEFAGWSEPVLFRDSGEPDEL
jgi:hypothetical protein